MPSVVTLKSWTRFQREDRLISLSSGLCFVFDIFKLANNSTKLIKEYDEDGGGWGRYWEEWRNGVKRGKGEGGIMHNSRRATIRLDEICVRRKILLHFSTRD